MAGSTTARGYGTEHQRQRKAWAKQVAAGNVTCRRAANGTCIASLPIIRPGEPWDLGHPDETCTAPTAPEHRACNRATSRRERRQARLVASPPRRSRRW